ncbi:MAG: protein-disulfide reductase DsbD [Rhodoferax sp.]
MNVLTFLLRRVGCRWVGFLGALAVAAPLWAADFLEPRQAFGFDALALDDQTLRLTWTVAPGYHLYRDQIRIVGVTPGLRWSDPILPAATQEYDPNFDQQVWVYRGRVDVDVRFTQGSAPGRLTVRWQGCADEGLCYQPDQQTLQVALKALGADQNRVQAVSEDPAGTDAASAPTVIDQTQKDPQAISQSAQSTPDSIAQNLASGRWPQVLGAFLLAGLLLSFTPCVLPMVPILSSLIAGQQGPVGRGRGLGLALAYSLGMALVYAGFGVAAGLAGEGLAAALQNAWVLGAFATLLALLALSMFGFYELQMPSIVQSRATDWSNRLRGGSFIGVFLMGGLSALVVGPCVAAPLAGALIYISQTRDVTLGGAALFCMAMGMSVPLLLVGLSAGSLLPRAGAWMERVKQVFGMMLLGVAIWMISPVIAAAVHMLLWAAWLLTAAALLGIFGSSLPQHTRTPVAARATGAGLLALALVLLVGAASGGDSILQPLKHLAAAPSGPVASAQAGTVPGRNGLAFERIASVEALDQALAQARTRGEKVMLDFYADWCVSCKEYESFTFSDPKVRQMLGSVRLLQADVSANSAADKALLKRFGLFGPPGIIFFDPRRGVEPVHKVVGYQPAAEFIASLRAAGVS